MEKPLNIGLIGCGSIAQAVHLPVLSRLPGVRVVGLAEMDPARLASAQRLTPRATGFADYRELLAKTQAEVVIVCAPTALHAEVGIATLQAGKHLYLEKPIATNLADADRLVDAWGKSGVRAMLGFNYRFHPAHVAARELIEAGRVGEPVAVRSIFSSSGGEQPAWKTSRATGGGVLLDLGSHHFDLLPFLLGSPIREVQANLRSVTSEDDCAAVTLRFDNGALAQSLFLFGAVQQDQVEIVGTRGRWMIDRLPRWRNVVGRVWPGARNEPSYAKALAHFFESIRTGRAPSPSLVDGQRSLAVALAAEESHRRRQPVALA